MLRHVTPRSLSTSHRTVPRYLRLKSHGPSARERRGRRASPLVSTEDAHPLRICITCIPICGYASASRAYPSADMQ
eukprot:3678544-Rhodomonas_salina.1